jgi:hypothetical protein
MFRGMHKPRHANRQPRSPLEVRDPFHCKFSPLQVAADHHFCNSSIDLMRALYRTKFSRYYGPHPNSLSPLPC